MKRPADPEAFVIKLDGLLKYLASKFDIGIDYKEGQVNAIIDGWHTFGDYFILRRELVDSGLLKRLPDGSRYWRKMI